MGDKVSSNKKWDKKIKNLREIYPKINNINWSEILKEEPEVFHSVVNGISKTNKNNANNLKVAKIMDTNYSELNFIDSLNVLWGTMSFRAMSEKTGIPLASIQKIRSGDMTPSYETMEQIAKSFNIDPSYFLDYRIAKILSCIDSYLTNSPETATSWYKKIEKNKGIKIK